MRDHTKARQALAATVLALLILAIPAAGASTGRAQCGKPPEEIAKFEASKEPAAAPDEPFTDETDQERTLAGLRGSGLVVNFWATWCAPCVKEMPALDALAKQLKDDGIVVLALSADREGAPVVRKFYEKNEITNLGIAIDRMSRVARSLKVGGLPTTILFDAAGREVGRVVGTAEWDQPATVEFLRGCLTPAA
jgi:thiol-disulfide isomerase/thioredoxin